MKTKHILTALIAALGITAHAATPEQEKAFVASYKKALETKDSAALKGFLYTEGASGEALEFFIMMQEMTAGQPIKSIELVTPTKEEAAKFNKVMQMPDGKSYKLSLVPTKQLVIKIEEKSENGSSSSTSTSPVAEMNGKLVIPVPVPAK